ncbi:MAG: hypothetical protein KF708_19200 [Pirellulales bacterium]|nr:hypothetical protein [Pirellulales bacterium]
MRNSSILGLVAAIMLVALPTIPALAEARIGSHACSTPGCETCAPAAPKLVERTVLVPEMSLETRTVMVPEYRLEQRQKKIIVPHYIPRQVTVERPYTIYHPKCVTRTVQCMVRTPVYADVQENYTVCVPQLVTKTGTRKVCKVVTAQKTQKVVVDQGHWEDAPAAGCGAVVDCASPVDCCRPRCRLFRRCSTGCGTATCGTAGCGSRVWVSNPVEKEVAYTCQEKVWVDEPYTCQVTVMKPETRTRTVRRCTWKFEPRMKQVQQTILEAEHGTKTCTVTRYDFAPEEKTVVCCVCVPHFVPKQVQVQICRMVPKTVQVPAPCETPSCAAPNCCENGCCPTGHGHPRRCRGC